MTALQQCTYERATIPICRHTYNTHTHKCVHTIICTHVPTHTCTTHTYTQRERERERESELFVQSLIPIRIFMYTCTSTYIRKHTMYTQTDPKQDIPCTSILEPKICLVEETEMATYVHTRKKQQTKETLQMK